MANDNVRNLPVVDKRYTDFAEKLENFIYEHGEDLPIPVIVGVLETAKHVVLNTVFDDLET